MSKSKMKNQPVTSASSRDSVSSTSSDASGDSDHVQQAAAQIRMQLDRMHVKQIMRAPAITISPDTSVRTAAALMDKLAIGVLPVVLDSQLVGVITERDITVRWVAASTTDTAVEKIISTDVVSCRADQKVQFAAQLMADRQIRQVVVVDAEGEVEGVVSLDDIANHASEELAGQTLGEIVEQR